METSYDPEKFQQVKKRAEEIIEKQARTKQMFEALADMYWISETESPQTLTPGDRNLSTRGQIRYNESAYDDNDVRLTATTSSRDRVTGLHRMLRTSKPRFSVECRNKGYADKIENALEKWWDASNAKKRAKLESELALSGILWSDENLSVASVDDLITDNIPKIRRRRLVELQKQTPFFFEVESALIAYPVWGDLGKSEHLTMTEVSGRWLKERWGITDVEDDTSYTQYDYYDLEDVFTWYEGSDTPLRSGPHGLPDLPHFTAVADGTDLFSLEERKRQPFLYGMWKSGLHKREDELLTSLFTSTYSRGNGPLVVVNKSAPDYDGSGIDLVYRGMVRILSASGNPQLADDKAYDANLINLSQMIEQIGERTTIASQTLGENIEPGTPYSGYAMASQNGRIPLVPIQEATEKVIHDACMYALTYFKENNIEWEGLEASEIMDDIELTVTLEVDLPQDKVRMAQYISQLKQSGVPLSNEYIHNELQIKDSQQMTFDVMSEVAAQEAFKQDLPQLVPQLMQMLQQAAGGMMGGGGGGMVGPGGLGGGVPNPQYPTQPGADMMQAGGEAAPATEPMMEQNNGLA